MSSPKLVGLAGSFSRPSKSRTLVETAADLAVEEYGFMAHTLPTAIYASDRDLTDYRVSSEPWRRRIAQAVDELSAFFAAPSARHIIAAE